MKVYKTDRTLDSPSYSFNTKRQKYRFWIWPLVALYVASLPYAIVLFDLLKDRFTLPVVKGVPALLLMVAALGYLLSCYRRQQGYRLGTFVLPTLLVLCAVIILESNPIKYLHVPEYMLLTCLIYLGLSHHGSKIQTIVVAALLASLLGVVDEVHQGMHPGRYFGWKDMLINAGGSVIGALFLAAIRRPDNSAARPYWKFVNEFRWHSLLLLISFLIGVCTILSLFQVAATASFIPTYVFSLFVLNLTTVALSLSTVIKSGNQLLDNQDYETLLFWPIIILMILHGAAAYAFSSGGRFL